jgi:hypothetical protein
MHTPVKRCILPRRPASTGLAGYILCNGDSIYKSIATRRIAGRDCRTVALYMVRHLELRWSTRIENILNYETAISAAQKDAQLEKRLTGLASNPIALKESKKGKSHDASGHRDWRHTGALRQGQEHS